ncbi:unnamed protein product [Thelazia callipaeda]|uniref:Apple domain-containing protein n=1 Tax=Thelazia callipaeda TaxID=103827 RepID=A0A0N5D6J3_THECL|nr:unnamed protein product [Thelazia callipaeda]
MKEGNCTLFEYDAMLLRCVLKNGTDDVMDDSKMHRKFDHNIALFQQLCLPDEQICPSPYAFERFPGFILLGIAKEVIKYASLEECLNICLSVKTRTEMECRSVMYYYDTGECILNSDNQVTSGTMLTNNTSNMRVDYFENYCLDVKCPSSSTMHWIKVSGFKINDKHNILMEHVTKEECCNYCRKNEVDGQIFPCKLYAYNEDRMTCYLTSKSGLANLPMSLPDDELIDNLKKYEYYEKICLQGSTRCQDSSFEHTSNHALLTEANKVIITTSVANCLDICLRSGKQCSSVMFFHSKDECVLNTISQDSNAQQLQYYPEVDYFDNVCDYKINMNLSLKSTVSEFSSSIHSKLNGTSGAQIVETQALYLSLNQNLFGNSEHEGLLLNNSNLKSMLETLETDCGAESIVINMQFDKPTNGAIFIKDHFATCHFEYVNSLYARMKIALVTLHQDNPPCPGYEINPSIWSFIVVVQKNDLGVPALMTDTDRIFNISCDYSNIHIAGSSEHDKMLSSDSSRDWSSSLASTDQVQLTVLRGDQPVSTAVMGEELEIKWTIMQDNENDVEMFVNRCIAERLDGIPPLPPSLTLISNGHALLLLINNLSFNYEYAYIFKYLVNYLISYIFQNLFQNGICIENKVRKSLMQHPIVHDDSGLSTKIKVFRFDGSHRVRILCSVDICAENCSPATCNNMDNGSILHFSKKKRQSLNYVAQKVHFPCTYLYT